MTTLAEVQMKGALKKATTQAEKETWATRIIVVRAIEYLDALRMFPMEDRVIKKIIALVTPCNVPAIQDILKEVEEEKEEKETTERDIFG